MTSGRELNSSSTVVTPTQVWTREEWQKTNPWMSMPVSDLRTQFKTEAFSQLYGGGPEKFRSRYKRYGSPTGRFNVQYPPTTQERRRD